MDRIIADIDSSVCFWGAIASQSISQLQYRGMIGIAEKKRRDAGCKFVFSRKGGTNRAHGGLVFDWERRASGEDISNTDSIWNIRCDVFEEVLVTACSSIQRDPNCRRR